MKSKIHRILQEKQKLEVVAEKEKLFKKLAHVESLKKPGEKVDALIMLVKELIAKGKY